MLALQHKKPKGLRQRKGNLLETPMQLIQMQKLQPAKQEKLLKERLPRLLSQMTKIEWFLSVMRKQLELNLSKMEIECQ